MKPQILRQSQTKKMKRVQTIISAKRWTHFRVRGWARPQFLSLHINGPPPCHLARWIFLPFTFPTKRRYGHTFVFVQTLPWKGCCRLLVEGLHGNTLSSALKSLAVAPVSRGNTASTPVTEWQRNLLYSLILFSPSKSINTCNAERKLRKFSASQLTCCECRVIKFLL